MGQILDVLDGTGSGDVDMSKVVEADDEQTIAGVYGNRLKLNPAWSNPTGAVWKGVVIVVMRYSLMVVKLMICHSITHAPSLMP